MNDLNIAMFIVFGIYPLIVAAVIVFVYFSKIRKKSFAEYKQKKSCENCNNHTVNSCACCTMNKETKHPETIFCFFKKSPLISAKRNIK